MILTVAAAAAAYLHHRIAIRCCACENHHYI